MCKFVGPRLDKSPGERWFDNLAKKLGKEHFHCFGICFCFSTGFSLLAVCCLLAFVSVVVCVCVWVFVFLFSLVFFFRLLMQKISDRQKAQRMYCCSVNYRIFSCLCYFGFLVFCCSQLSPTCCV